VENILSSIVVGIFITLLLFIIVYIVGCKSINKIYYASSTQAQYKCLLREWEGYLFLWVTPTILFISLIVLLCHTVI